MVLLVASRRNGRWGIPKGDIDDGETTGTAAKREAFEEGGVIGEASPSVFAYFTYHKEGSIRRFNVAVHLLEVDALASAFPEKAIRKTKWVSLRNVDDEVTRPGLIPLFAKFKKTLHSSI